MAQNEITVLRKRPDSAWETITIPNRLDCLQDQVGGYIETASFAEGYTIICNEEGWILNLAPNRALGFTFAGTILVVGIDDSGEEFTDTPSYLIKALEGRI